MQIEKILQDASQKYALDAFDTIDGSGYEIFTHGICVTLVERSATLFWTANIRYLVDEENDVYRLLPTMVRAHLPLLLEFGTSLYSDNQTIKILHVSQRDKLSLESLIEILEILLICVCGLQGWIQEATHEFRHMVYL